MIINYFEELVKTPIAKYYGNDDSKLVKSFVVYHHHQIKLRNARALKHCLYDKSHDCYTYDKGGCQYCNTS